MSLTIGVSFEPVFTEKYGLRYGVPKPKSMVQDILLCPKSLPLEGNPR
ncbi:hypothetical protein O77CONTIG1_01472 [Leptolyngbya sp. O-77]|nr:hypothetical protein O77CONTIG1_01472 [Leptolyngbya sp. O-77]